MCIYPLIGTLNINSFSATFEQLKVIIGNYLDILVIQETKLDPSYPDEDFFISGYTKPYRLRVRRSKLISYLLSDALEIQNYFELD